MRYSGNESGMVTVPSTVIFVLSVLELAVGMAKSELAISVASRASTVQKLVAFGVLLEAALCCAVNGFTISNAKKTDGSNLEWKLLVVAASFDLILLLIEWFFASLYSSYRKEYGLTPTLKLRFREALLVGCIALVSAPLGAHFFLTEYRADLIFSSALERRMVIAAMSLAIVGVLLAWMFLMAYSRDDVTGRREIAVIACLVCASGLSLLVASGLAVYGALAGDMAVLLAMLLVVGPPSASLTFAVSKSFLLELHHQSLTDRGTKGEDESAC